ncbi:DUF1800 domain-containing protein [Brevundimonas sp.]|jgi:uncharacterized protein (DUF1800 family)|uniref:DUF1800 domain-containing protein n=1 Tax=Brevundimonas sp. TaxID=1871086 RepID=UPI002E1242FB|nr:DUF1800 domain-containing protein [Brevundimonas sp.]
MSPESSELNAALALGRFGYGAGPGEIARVAADPRGWLEAQMTAGGALQPEGDFPGAAQQLAVFEAYREGLRPDGSDPAADGSPEAQAAVERRQEQRRALTQQSAQAFLARARHAVTTPAPFAERWAAFWANQVTVSATKFQSAIFIDSYEREAVRPNVFSRFEDLLIACESHPAMLLYLDQAQSVGPDSPAGRRREAGLNENLAREILELHTVGADGGYAQSDVTELARALTGWSIDAGQDARRAPRARMQAGRGRARQDRNERVSGLSDGFLFREVIHQPGERRVMGSIYADAGAAQGAAILRDLARAPQTARRLCARIAAHFTADAPDPALVEALERAWTGSGGDLGVVARALIAAPQAWTPEAVKMKTPYDFVISAHRALGVAPRRIQDLAPSLEAMGQPAWRPPSPEGWPDQAADWAGPDALVKRLDWSREAAARMEAAGIDPVTLTQSALGPRVGPRTLEAVRRAESRVEGLTLLLMSPEFQRR